METDAKSENKPKRKVNGRLITKENAKAYALSAAKAKALRKEARAKMLHALVSEEISLGDELKKAIRNNDEAKIRILEKAVQMVGLHWGQSSEAVQKLQVDANTNSKVDSSVKITVTGLDV